MNQMHIQLNLNFIHGKLFDSLLQAIKQRSRIRLQSKLKPQTHYGNTI